MRATLTLFLIPLIFLSCGPGKTENGSDAKAASIVMEAIKSYGGDTYENIQIEFDFRDRSYGILKKNGDYIYARIHADSVFVHDLLSNEGFSRKTDGNPTEVSDEMKGKYTNSINSVVYYALLPYGLETPAAVKEYLGESKIKGKNYHKIKVTFKEEGGGVDYEDEYVFWFEKNTYSMDYFAYAYKSEGGGTRFRAAVNKRTINGITFQDYINYKGEDSFAPVDNIEERYLKDELEEISRIELKGIKVTSPKVPSKTFTE